MSHNDTLRSITAALKLSDASLATIVALGGGNAETETLSTYLKGRDDVGFAPCPPTVMAQFLNGLVTFKRGSQEGQAPAPLETAVTNNVVLKKIRVALALKDRDIATLFVRAGIVVSKSERAAFFRHRDDTHYRECSDPVLEKFLASLTG